VSHTVCTDIGSWVDQNIQQQVEHCVEQDCNWWCLCCNKWFCGLIWVVVTVVTWAVQTVCETVADTIDVIVGFFVGLTDIIVGIVTGDWSKALGGLIEIFAPIGILILDSISITTLGTLVGAFQTGANSWALRDHVRNLIDAQFGRDPKTQMAIKDALGIDGGGFGLRLQATAQRCFLRSDFSTANDGVPDLIRFVDAGLNLKALAGFNPPAWWSRSWPELVPDSGSITAAHLDAYIASRGVGPAVKQFTLFSMSKRDLQQRLDVATSHAVELGLILRWTVSDTRLATNAETLIDTTTFTTLLPSAPFSRTNTAVNAAAAQADLCSPLAISAFNFVDSSFNGISAHLAAATCLEAEPDGSTNFPADGITGLAFRFRKPDVMFKYVAIHELGHTFGLCHVDGLLRIMFTNAAAEKKNIASWWSLLQYYTHGVEAGFILDEGKKAWDYILANFSATCLSHRPF
jgi:hypothetical protein